MNVRNPLRLFLRQSTSGPFRVTLSLSSQMSHEPTVPIPWRFSMSRLLFQRFPSTTNSPQNFLFVGLFPTLLPLRRTLVIHRHRTTEVSYTTRVLIFHESYRFRMRVRRDSGHWYGGHNSSQIHLFLYISEVLCVIDTGRGQTGESVGYSLFRSSQ